MGLAKIGLNWILPMFLISPPAWGETVVSLPSFITSVQTECRESFAKRLNVWTGIAARNRAQIASTICEDDRIFWSFAQGLFPEAAPDLERTYRAHHTYGPLTVGITGASRRETSEALHAVREMLYPMSNTVLIWNGDRAQMRAWQALSAGGRFGGVIHVPVRGENDEQIAQRIRAVGDAMSYMTAHHMDSFVLVVSSERDLRARFPDAGDPIRWMKFGCEGWLAAD